MGNRQSWFRSLTVACLVLLVVIALKISAQGNAADGKKIFVDQKCNSCHSITAQNIPVKKGEQEEKDDKEPPDLSGAGIERKADWIGKYLQKKESIKGEKHSKKFKGTDAELAVLSQWLETLKTKPKK